ncbi:MAG: stage V sporulation protein T [Ruminococcaceae bacterium]|nr:stage V sporulation protein T [Oscillospiraceae bacterium]
MKATGIVRRIDDLGRVVIPKEIRRTLRIREGDPLEIFTDREGEVIFKKYSPIGELSHFASQYAEVLSKTLGATVLVCDRDFIVAAAGTGKKDFFEKKISSDIESLMENRQTFRRAAHERGIPVVEGTEREAAVACPVTANGDVIGCVMIIAADSTSSASDADVKTCQAASAFLGKQMED